MVWLSVSFSGSVKIPWPLICGALLLRFNEPHSALDIIIFSGWSGSEPAKDDGLWRAQHLPDHGLEKPRPVSNGGHSLVHQRMHLNEVECVVGELIRYLVPLHGWRASTVARPVSGLGRG